MISRTKTVNVASMLSANLALRDTAAKFVQYIEGLPQSEVIVDFSGVKTITRSFAHEYCARKRSVQKQIKEMNVSSDVARMFEVVRGTHSRRVMHPRINFDGIPVVNL